MFNPGKLHRQPFSYVCHRKEEVDHSGRVETEEVR